MKMLERGRQLGLQWSVSAERSIEGLVRCATSRKVDAKGDAADDLHQAAVLNATGRMRVAWFADEASVRRGGRDRIGGLLVDVGRHRVVGLFVRGSVSQIAGCRLQVASRRSQRDRPTEGSSSLGVWRRRFVAGCTTRRSQCRVRRAGESGSWTSDSRGDAWCSGVRMTRERKPTAERGLVLCSRPRCEYERRVYRRSCRRLEGGRNEESW